MRGRNLEQNTVVSCLAISGTYLTQYKVDKSTRKPPEKPTERLPITSFTYYCPSNFAKFRAPLLKTTRRSMMIANITLQRNVSSTYSMNLSLFGLR